MGNHLEALARRLEDDPYFLACPLKLYARSEKLDEGQLAVALGCSPEALTEIRLCRSPGASAVEFQKDIKVISERFQLDRQVLAAAVRRGQAILRLRGTAGGMRGTLM